MFSCQMKDVFDHATLQKCSYTYFLHVEDTYNFGLAVSTSVVLRFKGTLCVESVPIHTSIHPLCTCVGSVPTTFSNFEYYMHSAPILSKLHTNYKI